METDPLFNSGRGSALAENGTVEMEASLMDGPGRRCGAVSGLTTVKNPISLARLVMEKSPHSYLAFSGAEEFARQQVKHKHTLSLSLTRIVYFHEKRALSLLYILFIGNTCAELYRPFASVIFVPLHFQIFFFFFPFGYTIVILVLN